MDSVAIYQGAAPRGVAPPPWPAPPPGLAPTPGILLWLSRNTVPHGVAHCPGEPSPESLTDGYWKYRGRRGERRMHRPKAKVPTSCPTAAQCGGSTRLRPIRITTDMTTIKRKNFTKTTAVRRESLVIVIRFELSPGGKGCGFLFKRNRCATSLLQGKKQYKTCYL